MAMEEKGRETITAFDSLMTTNRIQMMKVILSWLPPRQQGGFAVYIKFAEFQHAMQFLSRPQDMPLFYGHRVLPLDRLLSGSLLQEGSGDVVDFLEELLPFCGDAERARLESVIQMINGISKMKEMMEMMEMMKEYMGGDDGKDTAGSGTECAGTPGDGSFDFLSALSGMAGMSGMDLNSLFQMFGNDNGQDP